MYLTWLLGFRLTR